MSRFRVSVVVGAIGAVILSALSGCATGLPAAGSGGEESASPGDEAGPCLPDGTCDPGLECLDGVCVLREREAEEDTEGEEDEGEAEGAGEGEGGDEVEGQGEADGEGEGEGGSEGEPLLIFHNNSGPMCVAALDWLETAKSEYPTLVIEEHLTYEAGEVELLAELEAQFQTSRGVSTSFEYLPIVFYGEQAFSGFNDEIAEALQELLPSVASPSP